MPTVKSRFFIRSLTVFLVGLLALTGCLFSPDKNPDDNPPPVYHQPADSAWKVVANLQLAYVNRDLGRYIACFRDDYEFHLLESDWEDYNGDGFIDTYWGLDKEEEFHEAMFNAVEQIELLLMGTTEYPDLSDPTGQSWALPRTFDLKVYTNLGGGGGGVEGFRASGEALFVCRTDPQGEWYIWKWYDQSEN
jgi:hypothetical protein